MSQINCDNDCLAVSEILRWTTTKTIGRQIEYYQSIDSTNNRAKELAKSDAPHGYLVCANYQSEGKGRMERSFFSPDQSGIYITYLLRPVLPMEKVSMITSLAAVAVANAIESVCDGDVKVGIKWVNDLYINGRKVCGILCESGVSNCNVRSKYVALGIGVNVAPMVFPDALKGIATSIGNECERAPSRYRLIAEVSNQLEFLYPQLETGDFLQESRNRSIVISNDIIVTRGNECFTAHAIDIDDSGRLIVRSDSGIIKLESGEVSLKLVENK